MTVKEMREDLGYTQSEFADKLKVPIKTLQNWEQRRNDPKSFVFEYIQEVYNGLKAADNRNTGFNKVSSNSN